MRFNPFKKISQNPSSESDDTADSTVKALSSAQLKAKFADEITAIYRTSGIAQIEFETYFLPTIVNFLYFIQAVPATSYPAYDRLNGLAGLALLGSKNGLKIRNGLVLPTGVRADLIDKQKSRWSYLVVCSILLNTLRDNLNHCMVEAGDKNNLSAWDFSKGALGDYANFRFRKVAFDNGVMDHAVASFLLMRFVKDDSVKWLAEHQEVFTEFMAIINGHSRHCPNLSMFLTLDKVLPSEVNKLDSTPLVIDENVSAPVSKKKKKKKSKKKNKADAFNTPFFQWLFNAIESGDVTLNTNQSRCHVVEGGLFIELEAIAKQYGESLDLVNSEALKQEAVDQLAQHNTVSYSAYGRELAGHVIIPEVEFLSFTPVNDDLVLIRKNIGDR